MKTITITNLKGGVGKTTTAINLAHRLASEDKRVLLLDTDHQANLSRFFNAQSERNIYQLFIGKAAPQPYAISDNLHIISSDMETATINFRLIGQMAWHSVLRNKLVSSGFTALYDYCIIDCPPALDMIVTNALTAAGLRFDSAYIRAVCVRWPPEHHRPHRRDQGERQPTY